MKLLFFHTARNLNAPSQPRCIGHIGSGAGETCGGGRPEGVDFWDWGSLYISSELKVPPPPPQSYHPEAIGPYQGFIKEKMVVNNLLLWPYLLGGSFGGVTSIPMNISFICHCYWVLWYTRVITDVCHCWLWGRSGETPKNATVSGISFRILRDTHGWFMKKHAKIEDVEVEKWWRWKITLYNKRLW